MPKTIGLNAANHFIRKIPSKRELQQIASNHLSDIEFNDSMNAYKDYSKKQCSFLVNNTSLSSDNPLSFRTRLL